jgi:hypothetical protein
MAAQPSNDLPKRPSQANPRAISLRLVILFVSCCAIALGLIWHWPGAVPVVAIAVVIAVVRAVTMSRAVDVESRRAPWRIVAVLLGSLGIVSLVGATSAAAFVAVCFPLGATQFDLEGESHVAPPLRAAAWLLGGAAGALVAALTLDHLWLRPLAERADDNSTALQKQRIRSFLRATVPLLGAATVGGIASIIPGVSAGAAAPLSPPAAVACFVLTAAAGNRCHDRQGGSCSSGNSLKKLSKHALSLSGLPSAVKSDRLLGQPNRKPL